jgi:hypothetical protein
VVGNAETIAMSDPWQSLQREATVVRNVTHGSPAKYL